VISVFNAIRRDRNVSTCVQALL